MKTLLHACAKALPATAGWLLTVWLLASAAALPARGQFLTKEVIEAGLNGSEEDFKQALRKSARQKMDKYRKEHSFQLTMYQEKNKELRPALQFDYTNFRLQSTAKPESMHVYHSNRYIRTYFCAIDSTAKMDYTFSLRNTGKETLHIEGSPSIIGGGTWEFSTQTIPPGGLLTATVRNFSLNGISRGNRQAYLTINGQLFNLSLYLFAPGQKSRLPTNYIMAGAKFMQTTPWDARAEDLEQQAEDRRQQENERKRLAEEAERKRARRALEAALADTVYPYTKSIRSNNRLNFCTNKWADTNKAGCTECQIAIEDTPGRTVMLLIGMDGYGTIFDLQEALMTDSRTTNYGDSTYIRNDYPIALHLSNGETLSTRQGSVQYSILIPKFFFLFGGFGEEYIMPAIELLLESDRKDLSGLSVMQRHAYTVSRLSRYNIESITLDGTTFKLGDVRTANTLKAMFADAEKATGDTGKYHYTEPSAQATPAASPQPSESETDTGDTYEPPSFPGGSAAMMQFIAKNLRYPKAAQEAGVQGRVMLQFTVGQDGTLSDIKVLRSVSAEIDAEAVRVVRSMPRWTPAKANGKPISARYMVPVAFRLQ